MQDAGADRGDHGRVRLAVAAQDLGSGAHRFHRARSAEVRAFYGRIFDLQIFQEMMPPLRYYCRLGIGCVAFGPNANAPALMDHSCATVEDYRLDEMRAELKTHGLNLAGSPGFDAVTGRAVWMPMRRL